jgi:hypothetical protein
VRPRAGANRIKSAADGRAWRETAANGANVTPQSCGPPRRSPQFPFAAKNAAPEILNYFHAISTHGLPNLWLE